MNTGYLCPVDTSHIDMVILHFLILLPITLKHIKIIYIFRVSLILRWIAVPIPAFRRVLFMIFCQQNSDGYGKMDVMKQWDVSTNTRALLVFRVRHCAVDADTSEHGGSRWETVGWSFCTEADVTAGVQWPGDQSEPLLDWNVCLPLTVRAGYLETRSQPVSGRRWRALAFPHSFYFYLISTSGDGWFNLWHTDYSVYHRRAASASPRVRSDRARWGC